MNNTITLTSYNPDKPIQAIKAVRAVSGLSLKDAKEAIDQMTDFDRVNGGRRLNGKAVEIPVSVDARSAQDALEQGGVAYQGLRGDTGSDVSRAAALLAVSLIGQYGSDAADILDAALGLIKDA